MAWVAIASSVVSTVMSLEAQKEEKEAIRESNYRQARDLEERAVEVKAASQREMLEERRRKELVASRALAVSAAGGGGALDPTVVDILADIEGEGAYRESVAMYQGEQEALDLRLKAENLRKGVTAMERGYRTRQATTLLRGATSAYGAYSQAYPGSTQDYGGTTGGFGRGAAGVSSASRARYG